MGISIRFYLFPEDGSLRRIPQRIVEKLPTGLDAIPEFAKTRQRVAQVIVELEDARPVRILDARGFHWSARVSFFIALHASGRLRPASTERSIKS